MGFFKWFFWVGFYCQPCLYGLGLEQRVDGERVNVQLGGELAVQALVRHHAPHRIILG